ncbi:flagellar filament capping protein FliD [Populibacterium corticicola]|uniref:Flagellar hook-associated protein 2 n=1 Tax=Populibacterium corticicola TaxID=1812826 RepID=A0ABW5XIV2_9MICO
MGMSIGGIASGLKTAEIIEGLMQLEAVPQTYLKQKQSSTNNFVTALQALNAKVSSLADNAKNLTTADAFSKWTTTVSSNHASATASTSASTTDLTFKVNHLAQGRSALTSKVADAQTLVTDGKFTFTTGTQDTDSFKEWSIDVAEDATLSDIADAITKGNSGLRASVITTGDGSRLQLTNTKTGVAAGQFEITSGDGSVTLQNLKDAQDAEIELWPGMGLADSIVTSSSNTFTDLAGGVSLTVAKVHAADDEPTSLTVNQDTAAITKLASNLVSQVGQVLSEISSRSSITTTGTGSNTKTTGGLFTGDAQARLLTSQISNALSYPVDGKSPSVIGIDIQKDGTFVFDEAKFTEALTADPEGTQAFLTELGSRVEAVASAASDKYEGSITKRIESQQTLSSEYSKQIEDWDRRLKLREESLKATYTAMEVALSKMQGTMSQLSGQLSQLANLNSSS